MYQVQSLHRKQNTNVQHVPQQKQQHVINLGARITQISLQRMTT